VIESQIPDWKMVLYQENRLGLGNEEEDVDEVDHEHEEVEEVGV